MTEFNYVPNPRFHIDAAEWFNAVLWTPDIDRVTSVPWGGLPEGADAVGRCPLPDPTVEYFASSAQPLESLAAIPWTVTWGAPSGNSATGARAIIAAVFYDALDELLGWVWVHYWDVPVALNAWHVESGLIASGDVPVGATWISLALYCYGTNATGAAKTGGYFTLACLGANPYGDGDFDAWEWRGAAHASVSSSVDPQATVLINGGAVMVFDDDVSLRISSGTLVSTEMRLRNGGDAWGEWQAYATSLPWTLAGGGAGPRSVEVEFR